MRSCKQLAAVALGVWAGLVAVEARGADFDKGTQAFSLGGSVMNSINGANDTFYGVQAGYHYYLADGFSIAPTVAAWDVNSMAETDILGASFSLPLRWHFARWERWSLFIEASPGVGYFAGRFPPAKYHDGESGTNFNFFLGGTLGVTYKITEGMFVVAGPTYLHVSNAGIQGANRHPGTDVLGGYLGLLWTF